MVCIKYNTWKKTCEMYFNLKKPSQKAFLQWFPFSLLKKEDKEFIISKSFYDKYICTGAFFHIDKAIHRSENYIQKSDGSFRNASLISPILYLVLQSLGKEVFDAYVSMRPSNVSVYYAGDYNSYYPSYKKEYDLFFKEINSCAAQYQYFIKTDISSFYTNINIDELIFRIDKICNANKTAFSLPQIQFIKEFLLFCGNGRFPLVENSMASSFLATVVYLDAIDMSLCCKLEKYSAFIQDYRIVRYVDDMYILFSSDKSIVSLHETYNEI